MTSTSSHPIADEKYVALTTYRRNGESSSVPVWIVGLESGEVGFTTSSHSLKANRIGHDARVVLQPSDGRGNIKPGSSPITGTAVVAPDLTAIVITLDLVS